MTTLAKMPRVSLRRLLSKLTVLALSTSALAVASPARSATKACIDEDLDDDLDQDLDHDLDDDAPIDREHVDSRDAAAMLGRSLANALSEVKPLSAIHLATTWALSGDPLRRAAVARSLEWTFPLLGAGAIIEHLSYDADPSIRAAAARAAWVRRTAGGDRGVLDRLALDPDADVRAIALSARRG
jgi:hypothetical protein